MESAGGPVREGWLGEEGWRAGAIGFLASFLLAGGGVVGLRHHPLADPPIAQPIAFNHRAHVQEREIDCSACHPFYAKQTFSGLPDAEVCSSCHAEAQGKSEEEAKLVRLLKAGVPLVWKPLFRQPPHVFYSHRRHVGVARIECKECHGSIAEAVAPPGHVTKLRMGDCIDCHRTRAVSTACTTCHR